MACLWMEVEEDGPGGHFSSQKESKSTVVGGLGETELAPTSQLGHLRDIPKTGFDKIQILVE